MNTFKKWCIVTALSFISGYAIAQQDSIQISGTLKDLNNHVVYISFKDENGANKYFRTTAKGNNFSLTVPKQTIPVIARLDISLRRDLSAKVGKQSIGSPAPSLNLFVYNKPISVNGDALLVQFASIKGDEENNRFEDFKKATRVNETRSYLIHKNLFQNNYHQEALIGNKDSLEAELTILQKRHIQAQREYVSKNPNAFATIYLLTRMQNLYTAEDFIKNWNKVPEKYKTHPDTKSIANYIKEVSVTLAGTPAKTFERKDKDGKTIRLADYKGKTVLLDFWGSWCGPCRASHPHLKELYKKYKKDGFEIIAIAHERAKTLDEAKAAWLKAIEEDQINWVHILNMDGIEQQNIVKDYGVMAFPTKILVDKEGKILLRISASATDDIDKALEKIYGH
ncbi:MAG: TlpA disulfide reductase family protein [Pedobacter sp.]|uniref:TlpA family protein disulfide reductase n=1 Tax=Pedobacter sp. TaxID=1411316 RepID=UPI0028090C20|nr:TlpA disulfide reductase family protein [Pedobacter sp.]MDQ8005177.1 TlpA disulfide reductase family protein [Pedobacter sp.]